MMTWFKEFLVRQSGHRIRKCDTFTSILTCLLNVILFANLVTSLAHISGQSVDKSDEVEVIDNFSESSIKFGTLTNNTTGSYSTTNTLSSTSIPPRLQNYRNSSIYGRQLNSGVDEVL